MMQNCNKRLQQSNWLKRTLLMSLGVVSLAQSVVVHAEYQSINAIKDSVQSYLQQQAAGLPGQTSVEVGQVDPYLRLPACDALQPFLPAGHRAWGKTSVGVKCVGASKWTIYVQAQVQVHGSYVVTSTTLHQGKVIEESDLAIVSGDLTRMPAGVFTNTQEAIGKIVKMSMPAGATLKESSLKVAPVIQRGQTVVITSAGPGFKVAAEGKALANAIPGQVVQVKVSSGQVIAGIAKPSGQIEVKF